MLCKIHDTTWCVKECQKFRIPNTYVDIHMYRFIYLYMHNHIMYISCTYLLYSYIIYMFLFICWNLCQYDISHFVTSEFDCKGPGPVHTILQVGNSENVSLLLKHWYYNLYICRAFWNGAQVTNTQNIWRCWILHDFSGDFTVQITKPYIQYYIHVTVIIMYQ